MQQTTIKQKTSGNSGVNKAAAKIEAFRMRFGIPGSALKILACISMLIDHTAATVVRRYTTMVAGTASADQIAFLKQLYYVMRRIGRLAFPIYCFLIIEGFLHTRNLKKYLLRMFVFALISEFPFDFALHHGQGIFVKQNVYFTLLIGLLVLTGIRAFYGRIPIQLAVMASGMIAARLLKTDYSYHGVFLIELLYITRFSHFWQCACGASYMQYYEHMPTPMAFIPVWLYNGKRGKQLKYVYYAFYPGHLLLLGWITWYLLPRIVG